MINREARHALAQYLESLPDEQKLFILLYLLQDPPNGYDAVEGTANLYLALNESEVSRVNKRILELVRERLPRRRA